MLNERTIQIGLVNNFRSSWICACPNFTPGSWWECDLWAVTKAGYDVEFEIKLSIQDFRADAAKSQTRMKRDEHGEVLRDGRGHWVDETIKKHEQIASGAGPSRFSFAVPHELVELVRAGLPDWAGLISMQLWRSYGATVRKIVVPAPRLHGRKVDRKHIRQAERTMWYRYWECLRNEQRSGREVESAVEVGR